MKSVHAFTLIELLVAMILSVIATVLTFYGYQLIQQQYLRFKNYTSQVESYHFFVTSIQRDIENAKAVFLTDERLHLKIGNDDFAYQFRDTLAVRYRLPDNQKPDTFNISAKLEYTAFEKAYRAEGFIDELEIQIKLFDKQTTLPLHKWYSAQELMDYEHWFTFL